MIAEQTSTAYAPFPLLTRGDELGLETRVLHTPLGEMTVHAGRRDRTDETATIMLHGAAGSWTTFTPLLQAADLRGDATLRNVIIPDLPGWGASGFPADADRFTIDRLTEAIAHAARSLGFDRWRVIGHSLGGTLALHLAVVESEATAGITLVSPSAFGVLEAVTHPLGGLARIPLFVGMRQTMRILAIREQAGRAISRGLGRIGFTRGLATPLFRHPSFIDASVYDALAAEVRPRAFTAAAEATRDYDAATIWSQVACAATVLRGDRDVFVAADDLPRLVALVPRIRAITVPDAGHFAHVERPFEVLDTVGQAR